MNTKDIKRLNYIKYTAFRDYIPNPPDLLHCLYSFLLSSLISFIHWHKGSLTMKEILFVVPSLNNQKSVKTILNHLPEEKCTVWREEMPERLPCSKINLLSLCYIYLFLWLYLISSKEDRKLMRSFFYDFVTACATYKVLEKALLKNPQLKMVIMANDHVLITRCLIELTEKHHIKSLYVQHASITSAFPPLRFDYSFLDGMESYEKYVAIGNMRGHVFLSGSPRFDDFYNYQGGERNYDIGIALNEFDSEDTTLNLCLYLKDHYSSKIIVRPHPGMLLPGNLLFHKEKFIGQGFAVSDSRKDMSYVFLADIKVMIANESGIHLDAAMMGVPSMLYNFSNKEVSDWYSYIKKGLIKKCDSFDEIVSKLGSDYKLPVEAVRYYAASFKTSRDGKIGEMIAEFIKKEVFESEEAAFKYIEGIMDNQGNYAYYRS